MDSVRLFKWTATDYYESFSVEAAAAALPAAPDFEDEPDTVVDLRAEDRIVPMPPPLPPVLPTEVENWLMRNRARLAGSLFFWDDWTRYVLEEHVVWMRRRTR